MANTTKMPNTQLDWPDVGYRDNTWGTDERIAMFNNDSVNGGGIDDLIAGVLVKQISTVSDTTLTAAEAAHHTIILTTSGDLTTNVNVIVPTFQRNYRMRNDTTGAGFDLTVKTSAGSGVLVRKGEMADLSCDGTNVIRSGSKRLIEGVTAGSNPNYTLTPSPALTEYEADQVFGIRASFTNTGACSLNVSGRGGKNIRRWINGAKVNLIAGEVQNGQQLLLVYDGTDLVVPGLQARSPKVGATTRAMTTASGSQSITGVGFKPSYVSFLANVAGTAAASMGTDNGATASVILSDGASAAGIWSRNSTSSIFLRITGGNQQVASISSMDADGFTLGWVKTGSPTGTADVYYTCHP